MKQEIIDLHEAYTSIYTPVEYLQESYEVEEPQYFSEEVMIASQYFCEMGLNEIGVEILIEELGLDEFVDFVYDIAEEYYLTEARRGPGGTKVRIEPVTAKGDPYKGGKPNKSGLKRLQDLKQKRRESEEAASAAKPSGMRAALQRQDAIVAASKRQPKRKGFLDHVVDTVDAGVKRHNAANKGLSTAASEVGKLLGNLGRRVGGVAREFGSGASGTARLAGRVASKGLGEEVEYWVNSLVEEGYDLSDYTWDDMYDMYIAEKKEKLTPRRKKNIERQIEKKAASDNPNYWYDAGRMSGITGIPVPGHSVREETDLYEFILDYLISEGYTDTVDDALVIMANMSEEWKESICEEILDERNRGEQGMTDRQVRRRRNLGGNARFTVSSSSLGDHGSQGAIQKFHARKSKLRQAIHKSGRHLRGDTGEGGRYEANKDHEDGYPSIRGNDGPF